MPVYPFYQVDAFTQIPLGGNPCAILFDAHELDDTLMLAIAREMNLSETSFVMRSSRADFKVRYFTPAEEIPMAGHPTIATTFALVDSGRLSLAGERTLITLEMQAGLIPVEIEAQAGEITNIVMVQKRPEFLKIYEPGEILPVFGLAKSALLSGAPIQTVSTGTPQLMVPVQSLGDLQRIDLDIPAYQRLRSAGDFFSVHLFCLQGFSERGTTFARHFAIPPDVIEDPFTGSATGGMAAYLWKYGLLSRPDFIAEQGHWLMRPGQANVEVVGTREHITAIRVGGSAVTILRGELSLGHTSSKS